MDWVQVLRTLGRDDFCFLLLFAVVLEVHGWLLLASAVGAQVYWMLTLQEHVRHRAREG